MYFAGGGGVAGSDACFALVFFIPDFSDTFQVISPKIVPGFCFSWVTLVSNRLFLPAVLNIEGQGVFFSCNSRAGLIISNS